MSLSFACLLIFCKGWFAPAFSRVVFIASAQIIKEEQSERKRKSSTMLGEAHLPPSDHFFEEEQRGREGHAG